MGCHRMKNMWEKGVSRIIHLIVSHPVVVAFLSIVVAVPFLVRIPDIRTVDNVDYFAIEGDTDVAFYEELKTIFGNDEFLIIAFKKENLFTKKNLELLKRATDQLAGIKGVQQIKSLSNARHTVFDKNTMAVRPFLDTIPDDEKLLAELKQRALMQPMYLNNIVSLDGKTAGMVMFIQDRPGEPDFRNTLISKVRKVLETYNADIGTYFIAGWPVTNAALARYMKKDLAVFIPVTYGCIFLAVLLFFQNGRLALIAMINTSLCMGCTMGLFPIFGFALNNVTTIVPPVVMALSLCDTVHIFSHLRHPVCQGPKTNTAQGNTLGSQQTYENTLRKLAIPCFLTTATTCVGFLSLYANDIPPIREFSLVAAIGILFEFFFAFTFLPAFMRLFDQKKMIGSQGDFFSIPWDMTHCLTWFSNLLSTYCRWICFTGILLIVIAIWLSTRLVVDTNLLAYFKPGNPVRHAAEFVERELAGMNTIDISFKAEGDQPFKEPENLAVIQALQDQITAMEKVDTTLSLVDILKEMNHVFHNKDPRFHRIPESRSLVSQFLLVADSQDLHQMVNPAFDHARMSIRISEHSTREQQVILQQIRERIQALDNKGMTITVSGIILQEVNIIQALVNGQIHCLILSVVIIMGILLVVLKPLSFWVLSILPNLFPIALNFGIMGLFNIPLNTSTALIAAVAICIAVDDTIHFLTEFKIGLDQEMDMKQVIQQTLLVKGRAIILSSLILGMGFGVMVFSQFVPTASFGILSALIMLWALIGDLLLLPAAALVFSSTLGIRRAFPEVS